MIRYPTVLHGYSLQWSPFEADKLAVATSQHYGIVGNGRLLVLSIIETVKKVQVKVSPSQVGQLYQIWARKWVCNFEPVKFDANAYAGKRHCLQLSDGEVKFVMWAPSELLLVAWVDALKTVVLKLIVVEMLEQCESGGDLLQIRSLLHQINAFLNKYSDEDIASRVHQLSKQVQRASRHVFASCSDERGDLVMIPQILPSEKDAQLTVLLNTLREARDAISALRTRVEVGPLIDKYIVGVLGDAQNLNFVVDFVSTRYGVPCISYESGQVPDVEVVVDEVLDLRDERVVLLASPDLIKAGLRSVCNAVWALGLGNPQRHWAAATLPCEERLLATALSRLWHVSVPADPQRKPAWTLRALHAHEADAPLTPGVQVTCGRSKDNFVRCQADGVSRLMCSLEFAQQDRGWLLTDKSRNGTYVNGEKIGNESTRLLKPGDLLQLAKSSLKSGSLLGQFVLELK